MGKPIKVRNPVKKRDFVALQTHHNTLYINPARSDTHEDWTIVQVAAVSRRGEATSIRRHYGTATPLVHIHGRPKIHAMANHQKGAASLFGDGTVWHTADDVRRAVLAAEGIDYDAARPDRQNDCK